MNWEVKGMDLRSSKFHIELGSCIEGSVVASPGRACESKEPLISLDLSHNLG